LFHVSASFAWTGLLTAFLHLIVRYLAPQVHNGYSHYISIEIFAVGNAGKVHASADTHSREGTLLASTVWYAEQQFTVAGKHGTIQESR
jgi:hypothetical protein